MPFVDFSTTQIRAANVIAWGMAHALSGYLVHRLPLSSLGNDGPLLRPRAWEAGGRVYERHLQIRSWKDRLPEAGAFFHGGYDKGRLPSVADGGLERFAAETRRAERGHWLSLLVLPLFTVWNPPVGVAMMAVYGFAVNAPFIAVQRYNRARRQRIASVRAQRLRVR